MGNVWRVIVSTVQFGKRLELSTERVYADTEEQAVQAVQVMGYDRLTGYRFERVERIKA